MLSEERIILMTRMASYERGEGRENVKIGNYFRADYIALHVLKAVVCAIISFGILFGLYMLCNIEEFLEDLYKMVGGYAVLTYIVCTWRYARAKKSLKCYYHNLKKLNSLYQDGQ